MTEPASCSGTTAEEMPVSLSEIAIGIDISASPCSVSVWNGSKEDIWENMVCAMIHRFSNETTLFNMKLLVSIRCHECADFPFLIHTLDTKVHPFIAAFVNKAWKSTNAIELLAKFLMEISLVVETRLKTPIKNVVFTVPVSLSRLQLTRIHRACAMAGLHVLRLMPKPTAVALLYAKQQLEASVLKISLIFNMDAGYCDVALIGTEKGKCQIIALTGSAIGGEHLLENFMCHLVPDSKNIFKKHVQDEEDKEVKSLALLRSTIQKVVAKLSHQKSVKVTLDSGDGLKTSKVVTRDEFEIVNKEVFKKCERLILQCLQDAKIEVEYINDVIMVGGYCNIPKVKNLVTRICNRTELYEGMNPSEAALSGAAMAGAIAFNGNNLGLELIDLHVTHISLGIRANGNNFVPIIPRNTPVPTMWNAVFTTIRDNQTAALIVIYEGEEQKAEENHLLGYFKVTEIPEAPKGTLEIHVCMNIDENNKLSVVASAWIRGPQQGENPFIQARMARFDDEQLGWCDESLIRNYGDTMDLVTLLCETQ